MEKLKKRHGCLTAWLVLLIIFHTFTILGSVITYFLFDPELLSQMPGMPAFDMPTWLIVVAAIYGVVCLVVTIALFAWRKWAFWGFIGINILYIAILMLTGRPVLEIVTNTISGILSIVILFAVLQIGGEDKKGWTQLE